MNFEDHVINRLDVPVERNFQVDFCRAGTNVIGEWERATKTFRRNRAFQRGQKRLGVAIRNRKRGNFGKRGNVFQRQSLYVALGTNAGRGGIAGIDGHVHHAAALHAIFIAHGAIRKNVILKVAVVARIGIDDAADSAVLRCDLGLDATPRIAVARNYDCAFY